MLNIYVAAKALLIFVSMISIIFLYLYITYNYAGYKGCEPLLGALMFFYLAFELGLTYWNHNKRELI